MKMTKINAEFEILKVLAHNKEFEQFKMDKATKISYRTILRKLEPMKNKFQVIRFVKFQPSLKGGKDKKIWAITLKGLWIYLSQVKNLSSPEGKKELEQIIKRFPDMLLFFRKWPLFVKAGIQNEMLGYFVGALKSSWLYYRDRIGLLHPSEIPKETFHKIIDLFDDNLGEFLDTLILVDSLFVPKTKEFLKTVYLQDQELTIFVNKILGIAERNQARIEEMKTWINKKV